jgi:hypothetical protein
VLKKFVTSAIMAGTMAVTIPFAATTAEAHPGCKAHRSSRTTSRRTTYRRTYTTYPSTTYANGYSDSYNNGYYTTSRTAHVNEQRPGFYSRHRRLVNTGAGAAIGALVGGLLGGKRGAGVGLLAGGGGSQIFTHYQRPRNYTRYRR